MPRHPADELTRREREIVHAVFALGNLAHTVQDKLAQSVEGSPQQGSVDYTASVFANYTFNRGELLKGWSFGAAWAFDVRSATGTSANFGSAFFARRSE